jgi:hypothetical protein
MIRVRLTFVPPGGGEVDYGLTMDMPAVPRAGDYISVMREPLPADRPDYLGAEDFLVRRVWWFCKFPDDGRMSHEAGKEPVGTCEVNVECEFAVGPWSSPAHKRNAGTGKARAPAHEFENTNY